MSATRTLLLVSLAATLGCASGAAHFAEPLPGSRLGAMQRFYVLHQLEDPRDIHLDIRDVLRELGYQADAGNAPASEADYDAIVSYVDRYIWDMTMYCLQLTVYVRDTRTGYITATG